MELINHQLEMVLDRKMEAMHITAIGNTSNNRSYYILVKESLVEKPLNEIMKKIDYGLFYYGEGDSPTECENCVDHVVSGKYDIDIVYTSNRIILIVRAPRKQQEIFKKYCLHTANLRKNDFFGLLYGALFIIEIF